MARKGNIVQYEIFRKAFIGKKIIDARECELVFPEFDRERLSDWQSKGYIKKIINGFYIFSELDIDEFILMRMANVIYSHSYISLETALSYYGLIPESVYQITSCSTRKTKIFNTTLACFSFRSISPKYFFGYTVEKSGNNILIASPEKAVLDYLYFRTQFDKDDFYEWRLNIPEYKNLISEKKMENCLELFQSKALAQRYKLFQECLKNA